LLQYARSLHREHFISFRPSSACLPQLSHAVLLYSGAAAAAAAAAPAPAAAAAAAELPPALLLLLAPLAVRVLRWFWYLRPKAAHNE
jgi:hypothetical protein